MRSELMYLMLACVLIFGTRFIPPDWKYLSSRKRRAMRLALCEFTATHELTKPDKHGCRIYKSDEKQCIVMILEYMPQIRPPVLSFYSVADDSDQAIHLGSGQCHWGNLPEDLWEYPDAIERSKRIER